MSAILLAALVRVGVTGTIQSADHKPIPAAVVIAVQDNRTDTATTGADGTFALPNVTLPVAIEVRASGFTTARLVVKESPVTVTLAPSGIHESVIVTANDREEEWRRPMTGTTVLSAETLAQLPAVTADEALRVIGGFSLFRRTSSRASNPTTQGVTMRGLSASGSSRGLVLFDGVPLNDGFGGWVTWTRIPTLATSSVAIDRGAEGSTFGSDALGGALDIATRNGDRRSVQVAATGGSLGVGAFDASAGGASGRSNWFGAASYFRTDGVIPVAPESRGAVDVAADAEWWNAFVKVTTGDVHRRLTFSALGGSDDRGNGTPLQRNTMSGGTGQVSFDGLYRDIGLAARVSVSPNSFEQSFSSVAAGRGSETLTSTQFTDAITTRAIVEAGRPIPKGYVTARGTLAWASATFKEVRPASTTSRDLTDENESVSAHGAWNPLATVSLGAGIRHEWRAAPTDDAARDEATVGNVTAAWQMTRAVALRGSFATSHRWPTLNELVRNFQVGAVLTLANPDLNAEHAQTGDVALAYASSRWSASAGGFWTTVDNAISNVTIQSTPTIIRQRQNAGTAVAHGFELDAEVRPWTPARLRVSALLVDSRFRDSLEPALEGNDLPQVPRTSVSVSGDVRVRSWLQAAAVYRYLSSQFDDDRNVFELAPASQFDLRLLGDIKLHAAGPGVFTWNVTVENAGDSRIEAGKTPLVTLAPGRSVRVGITWRR
ncbi:MAG TPA: TonB-dependent receptor [Vicinamibacterales bacterium]|nr:TonB-dependent receptor [Vicinamibacterales bacterium]